MSAEIQLIFWAGAAYAALGLNILTKRDADSVGSAGMLLVGWLVARLVSMMYDVPDSMRLYPVQDALFAVVVFCALVSRPAWWKLALVSLLILQLCLHTAFWYAWNKGHREALPFYREMNNGTFALELLVVSWGAIVDVASHALRRVPHWGGVVHLRKVGP
mgnify:FL=1